MMSSKDYAAKLLSFCDRSEKEIREKILKKGYSQEECEEAVEFCREYGYIDDIRFANHFVHDCVEIKKYGAFRIRMELKRRGISDEIIEDALSSIENEKDILKAEMERRFPCADFSDMKVKNKIFGYFSRRGYKPSDILYAMEVEDIYE
ncbi:MAG: regulatory protein RecX [Clostridia bacterium]